MRLAIALVLIAALGLTPAAQADEEPQDELPDQYPNCRVFQYSITPPGFNLHPECLYPLPPPVQEVVDEITDAE